MNQIFDMKRFGDYMKKYVVENKKRLLISGLLVFLLPVALISIEMYLGNPYAEYFAKANMYRMSGLESWLSVDPAWRMEVITFNILFMMVAIIGASMMFCALDSKNSRIEVFTNPASNLEKALTYYIIYILALLPVFFLGTVFADLIRVWMAHSIASEGVPVKFFDYRAMVRGLSAFGTILTPDEMWKWWGLASSTYLITTGIYILGSVVWPSKSFVKTSIFCIVFNIISGIVAFMGHQTLTFLHGCVLHIDWLRDLSANGQVACLFSVCLIFYILVLWLAYARFKEWEVVKRW